jgi:microcystin-dependent protein
VRAETADPGDVSNPTNATSLAKSGNGNAYQTPLGTAATMADQTVAPVGGDQPHNNMMPYLTCYFCIALQGVFPPRT